jgi:hypothetical protein
VDKKKEIKRLIAEYAVAGELCWRDIYAQLTLCNHEGTDILAETERGAARIQVKGRWDKQWPHLRGPRGRDTFLVLVDLKNKRGADRPDFYILTTAEWDKLLKEQRQKQGCDNPDVEVAMVLEHKEQWMKIEQALGLDQRT